MKRTTTTLSPERLPPALRPYAAGAAVYDSSCSPEARVWFLDRDGGYFLKTAPTGALQTEAELTAWFRQKGLSAEVLAYESGEADWLLTRRIPGEDCIHPAYLDDPRRLCDTTAELLRTLHETDPAGCPVPDRTKGYLETAKRNYRAGIFDPHLFPGHWTFSSADEAWALAEENARWLKTDTLLHGDYCLPNILLDSWAFRGFIDVGNGGIGDRHMDLFWGVWTLFFNLHTDRYADRFLDAYGRWDVEPELLRVIAAIECFG